MCRELVLRVLAIVGDQQVIDEAKNRFEKHLSGEKLIPADIRSAVKIIYFLVFLNLNH